MSADDATSVATYNDFMSIPQAEETVLAEYIWIGGNTTTDHLRSKTRTLKGPIRSAADCPMWNYDGSSTEQAPGNDSEVFLKPVAIFLDPFRRGANNILVLCECVLPTTLEPIPTNTRAGATDVFNADGARDAKPWFGIEQEYTLFEVDGVTPLGWPKGGYPGPQGPYYCGAGANKAYGRKIVEAHYRACLFAGIKIAGCNAEVMAGQWEYQVGPCEGIESGDHVVMSRYIMTRVCEAFNVVVSFHPKPIKGDWNGAGCHTNYSTAAMRSADGGYDAILDAVNKLSKKHMEHMAVYGEANDERCTGKHETASYDKFSFGVANRGASVRIPRQAEADGCGYFEDRRPASNMDPYAVTSMLVKTTVLGQ